MKSNKIWKILLIILVPIAIISSIILIHDFKEYKESKESNDELTQNVITEDSGQNQINWKKLKGINPDIVAWIKIDNTNINYPVLKDNAKLYYLNHTFNKKYNSNGAIFTLEKEPFEVDETLIFGHNMKNKIMFSSLDKYMNQDYFYSHLKLHIYTEKKEYEGEIFSAYSIGYETENANIKNLDFEEKINYYNKASKYKVDNMKEIKKVVKLSTCSYLNAKTRPTNQRYYIIASLSVKNEGGKL